ncbi:MAG: N-acetylmuramoyl-L-alanine amidase [Lachnospiraceae bacterium]|nr:N-acetylmuramoyl-L-alanine amidase [Lachnospiraceae bacterium]
MIKVIRKQKTILPLIIIAFLLSICIFKEPYIAILNTLLPSRNSGITIAIDPGHGGYDPGKVGVNGTLEKDVNLAISLHLKDCLEQMNYKVVLTRSTDTHLYTEGCKSKKTDDLNHRISIIEDASPVVAVSIHQNSFQDSTVSGAQVFYYNDAGTSKLLADSIQSSLIFALDPSNSRVAKANSSYYMLKNTSCPTVIVECGFLSNPAEEVLLTTEHYQKQTAQAICNGIITYIRSSH